MTFDADLHVAAWTVVAGSILFFVGAGAAPEPSRVFTGDRDLYLDVLHRREWRWRAMTVLMVAGVVLTAAGLVALGQVWSQPFGIGATSFAIGAALGVIFLVTRAMIDVDVAHLAAAGGPVPDDFARWQRFTGVCFTTYLLLAYAATLLVGIAVIARASAPRFAGWFAVIFGGVAFVANVTGWPRTERFGAVFEPPFMVHIPPLILGISLLRWHPS